MTSIPPHFCLHMQPVAAAEATIVTPNIRLTVLTERLIRLEYSPVGTFEDRASQVFWYRQQPIPLFTAQFVGEWLEVETAVLHLRCCLTRPFSPHTLQIVLKPTGTTWHYGDTDPDNLRGTYRTLDHVSGRIPLEPGLLSPSGWAVVDDSHTLVFDAQGWLRPREAAPGTADLYFWGYGREYRACLEQFGRLAGPVPLLPRWALGNWWSRYWAYTQEELMHLMTDFRARHVPLSVCIVDMDWHLVANDSGVSGWTGYTWNRDLFPDPPAFLAWLHGQGLKTALNLHPADGVHPHEGQYPEMARQVGIDPTTRQPVRFAIDDPTFALAYLTVLHHPQEEDGVDFWWLDWQQGEQSGLPGLDPLWWLNHLHFYDLGRDGQKRPFIFSRWGGLGNHRYPIGFSGDTHVTWESLAFQPYFTATAANVGYGWWSHDIGGHMMGREEAELYTRWVQFGVFSPIMRMHSTKNSYHERRPWGYDAETERITREAMQLRHALIPYLYTLSWRNEMEHRPPVRPLYHDYPDQPAAYACPQQYTFGDDLIVAPFTAPADLDTRRSRQVVWLPPGEWYDFFSGEYFAGDAWYAIYGRLADVPVFARAGAIVPLGPKVGWGGVENPLELHWHVFTPAATTDGETGSEFVLYEDDGQTMAYRQGEYGLTRLRQTWQGGDLHLTLAVPRSHAAQPERRIVYVSLYGLHAPQKIRLEVQGQPLDTPDFSYDAGRECLTIGPIDMVSAESVWVVAGGAAYLQVVVEGARLARRDRTRETLSQLLTDFRLDTMTKTALAGRLAELLTDASWLGRYELTVSPAQVRALVEVAQQVGVHHLRQMAQPDLWLLWNNRGSTAVSYRYTFTDNYAWDMDRRFYSAAGYVPRFQVIVPQKQWQFTADYAGVRWVSV